MKVKIRVISLILISLVLFGMIFMLSGTGTAEDRVCIRCHGDSLIELKKSVHKDLRCLDCHKDHGKDNFQASNLPVSLGEDVYTCKGCHEKEGEIYFTTYHGKHFLLGKKNVPTCTFCHEGHEPPLNDPSSPVNYRNIGKICAGCHGGSDKEKIQMAGTLSVPSTGMILYRKDRGEYIVTYLMEVLSALVLIFGLLFLLQWIRNLKGEPMPEGPEWPGSVWIQFALFFIFFVMAEQTGVVLFYSRPEGGIIHTIMYRISRLIMSVAGSDDLRSLIHRLGGVGITGLILFHMSYIILHPSFRRKCSLPRGWWKSIMDEIGLKVKSGKPSYPVKEVILYRLLVVWVVIMALTGIIQWKAFWFMKFAGFWSVRYAEIIHLWTGRILVMIVYAMIIGYGFILRPIARRVLNAPER